MKLIMFLKMADTAKESYQNQKLSFAEQFNKLTDVKRKLEKIIDSDKTLSINEKANEKLKLGRGFDDRLSNASKGNDISENVLSNLKTLAVDLKELQERNIIRSVTGHLWKSSQGIFSGYVTNSIENREDIIDKTTISKNLSIKVEARSLLDDEKKSFRESLGKKVNLEKEAKATDLASRKQNGKKTFERF